MLIVEYRTDGPLLKTALERAPGMTLRVEEEYETEGASTVIFWAEGGDFEAFEDGLDADDSVVRPKQLAETQTRRLYRIVRSEAARDTSMVASKIDLDLVGLESRATNEGWWARMRFPDRSALAEYRDVHRDRGFPFRIERIYRESAGERPGGAVLTDAQREALRSAYEAGHYDIPQRASQADVARRLDITPQALSERLRRGIHSLIEDSLRVA